MSDDQRLLVVDDDELRLRPLVAAIADQVEAEVVAWHVGSTNDRQDPLERFTEEAERGLALVVTDDDLTTGGTGLLGSAVTNWAQNRYIPVCNFSRAPRRRLPRERSFFEIRVPSGADEDEIAGFVARVYSGFDELRSHIDSHAGMRPAELLAGALGEVATEDDLAPYLASTSASWLILQGVADLEDADEVRTDLLTFLLGHVMMNAVLEFPGPILSVDALAAYCAVSTEMSSKLADLFASAEFRGPFSAERAYFGRKGVDRILDEHAEGLSSSPAEPDEYNRAIVELVLGEVTPHGCDRCGGTRGGYWCPFTSRPVCTREDCSETSDTWIPRGAVLARVERDYYERLSPLVGE